MSIAVCIFELCLLEPVTNNVYPLAIILTCMLVSEISLEASALVYLPSTVIRASLSEPHIDRDNVPRRREIYLCMYLARV